MVSKSKNSSYLKKIKELRGVKEDDIASLSEAEISAGILPIISNPSFSDLVKNHVLYGSPLDIKVKTKYGISASDDPQIEAEILRNELSKLIANKIQNSNIDTGDILPNKSEKVRLSPLPKEDISKGMRGSYSPYKGDIQLDFTRPEKDIMATYVHELGHKANAQSVGYEGLKKIPKGPKALLYANTDKDELPPVVKGNPLANEQMIPAKELINQYYGRHHRADAPNAWEIEAYRNLEAGKPIRDPMTRDLSPEYKAVIEKYSRRGDK